MDDESLSGDLAWAESKIDDLGEELHRAERALAAADRLAEAAARVLDVRVSGGIGVRGNELDAALAAYRAARGAR